MLNAGTPILGILVATNLYVSSFRTLKATDPGSKTRVRSSIRVGKILAHLHGPQ